MSKMSNQTEAFADYFFFLYKLPILTGLLRREI